jgi:hypothetical protein
MAGARLTGKRAATSSENTPKLISSFRFGRLFARQAPKGPTQLETGATRTTSTTDTKLSRYILLPTWLPLIMLYAARGARPLVSSRFRSPKCLHNVGILFGGW